MDSKDVRGKIKHSVSKKQKRKRPTKVWVFVQGDIYCIRLYYCMNSADNTRIKSVYITKSLLQTKFSAANADREIFIFPI